MDATREVRVIKQTYYRWCKLNGFLKTSQLLEFRWRRK